ncbi:MAG TPA: DUF2218 domain-containing protein [Sphingomonas sp.]|nr:DUF2218 domain-containing protein [Sphingomonas sp.]
MTRLELLRRRLTEEQEDSMTHGSIATVPTPHAGRYIQQLAKHWSHKFEVEFDAAHAVIRFTGGTVARLEAGEGALTARLDAPDAETLERMQGVLARHLDRFAFREAPLPFRWEAAEESAPPES